MNIPGIPDLQTAAIALGIGVLVGAVTAGGLVYKYEEASWRAAAETQKADAAQELSAATERARKAEADRDLFKDRLEKQHDERATRIESLLRDNRRLSTQLGGLLDPGRREGGCGAVPGGTDSASVGAGGSSGSRLSNEASEFLLEFAADADRAAEYAKTCHDWAVGLK